MEKYDLIFGQSPYEIVYLPRVSYLNNYNINDGLIVFRSNQVQFQRIKNRILQAIRYVFSIL